MDLAPGAARLMDVPRRSRESLRPWFTPERPGPTIFEHVVRTGVGRIRADRWPDPRVVLAELPGQNLALRGDPGPVTNLTGLVEAAPEWVPVLRSLDPGMAPWPRVIAQLPDEMPVPDPAGVRMLGPADAAGLAAIDPDLAWIHETWGGPEGLAAAGVARAVLVDGRPVSVAVPSFAGTAYEDIGVVTEAAHRGRGHAGACAAAVVRDVRSRGRRPSWSTSPDNAASLAVAARLSFVHHRDDVLYCVGVPVPG